MTQDNLIALKPCPFCGGEAERFTIEEPGDNFGGDVISCKQCGASSPVEFGRKENIVSRWNTRTIERLSPPLDGEPCPYCKGRGGWTGETKWGEQDADCDGCDGTGIAPTPLDGEGVIQADGLLAALRRAEDELNDQSVGDGSCHSATVARDIVRAALSTISTPREDEVERVAKAIAVALPRMREVPFEHWSPKLQDETRILARAAIAVLTPREQRMEEAWQPIEAFAEPTALSSGNGVLVAEENGTVGEAYCRNFGDESDGWWWANTSWGDYPEPNRPDPTHWRPLPEPPALSLQDKT